MLLRLAAAAWVVAIVAALAAGASGHAGAQDALLDDAPGCVFKLATGVDCAFCGMTHATVALGAGDLGAAHAAHPLAIVVLVGALALFGIVLAGRADLLVGRRRPLAILLAVAAIWAVRLLA